MIKRYTLVIVCIFFGKVVWSQRTTLPVDWRQHNLTKYNANVFNPALSFVRNESRNFSIWGRLQWIGIEDSPKTYLVNYNGRFGKKTGAGLALFQHNIGLFTDSGLMVNYARGIQLARESWLTFGVNVIGLRRGLNQANFITPEPDPVLLDNDDDIILTVMPGFNLTINNFNIGLSSENLFDYNFTISDQQTDFSDKIFLGYMSYDFRMKNAGSAAWKDAIFRTTVYGKSIPDQDTQYGVQTLMDVPKYGWLQAGYNNFYGVSGGLGVKVSDGIVVGMVVETGTSATNRAFGATYEVTAAIEFGKGSKSDKPISFKEGPKPKKEIENRVDEQNELDAIEKNQQTNTEADKLAAANKKTETDPTNKAGAQKDPQAKENDEKLDYKNIENVDLEKLRNINRDSDSTALKEIFKVENKNPRYKAVDRIEGVDYGFYLVVNVFSQKKYFDLFMRLLTAQGLEPKYFYNNDNDYYYVYLRKYDKLSEVERDRRTKYNGRYSGETWILWVRNN